jgi:hypothetical protein
MKTSIVILGFFMVAATNSAKAQTKITDAKVTATESSAAHPAGLGYSEDAFTGSIGPHYAGHDLRTIYRVLEGRLSPKGEYEKTSEYQDRLRRAIDEPIVGGLKPSGLFAFVFKPKRSFDLEGAYLEYDADTEEMTVNLNSTQDDRNYPDNREGESSRAFIWTEDSKSRSYVGSNAFGASAEVTSSNAERYALLFDISNGRMPREGERFQLPVTNAKVRFHLSVAEARNLSDRLRVLVVCSIKEPPVTNGNAYNAPTISHPIEIAIKDNYLHVSLDSIWVFDDETGKVYVKSTDAISSVP